MARPGARGLGPGLGLKYDNCVVGRAWTYFLRAGPGPHNSVCGPGPGQVCTTATSNHICGPGLGLNFRPVQGPTAYLCRPIQPTCRDSRLRQPSDRELHRPVPNKAIGAAAFGFMGRDRWNKLPERLRESASQNIFKLDLKTHLLSTSL